MGEPRHYGNAPITEAIIDLRVSFEASIEIVAIAAAFASEQERYPNQKRLKQGTGQFEFGQQITTSARAEEIGIAFRSVDEKQVVQFRRDGFTFSRLAPYERWQGFRGEAERLWKLFRSELAPSSIDRLAVRYINRIELPPSADDLTLWLKTYPEIADGISQPMAGFFMHVMIPQPELDASLAIVETVDTQRSKDHGGVAIILDLDLFRTSNVPQDEDGIWEFFDKLHTRKNEVFESCITDMARGLFE